MSPDAATLAVDIGAVGVTLVVLSAIGRRLDARRARAGVWLFVLMVGALASALTPGASIFFLFPPAIMLAGIALARRWSSAERVAGGIAAPLLFVHLMQLITLIKLTLVSGPV